MENAKQNKLQNGINGAWRAYIAANSLTALTSIIFYLSTNKK